MKENIKEYVVDRAIVNKNYDVYICMMYLSLNMGRRWCRSNILMLTIMRSLKKSVSLKNNDFTKDYTLNDLYDDLYDNNDRRSYNIISIRYVVPNGYGKVIDCNVNFTTNFMISQNSSYTFPQKAYYDGRTKLKIKNDVTYIENDIDKDNVSLFDYIRKDNIMKNEYSICDGKDLHISQSSFIAHILCASDNIYVYYAYREDKKTKIKKIKDLDMNTALNENSTTLIFNSMYYVTKPSKVMVDNDKTINVYRPNNIMKFNREVRFKNNS